VVGVDATVVAPTTDPILTPALVATAGRTAHVPIPAIVATLLLMVIRKQPLNAQREHKQLLLVTHLTGRDNSWQ
jgi:hypothetical protein